jgi:hypothetical protein
VGQIKTYDVGGKEIDGRVMPTGTTLRLKDEDAERLGLKRASRKAEPAPEAEQDDDSALVTSKKAAASKKRAAPRSGRRPRS